MKSTWFLGGLDVGCERKKATQDGRFSGRFGDDERKSIPGIGNRL